MCNSLNQMPAKSVSLVGGRVRSEIVFPCTADFIRISSTCQLQNATFLVSSYRAHSVDLVKFFWRLFLFGSFSIPSYNNNGLKNSSRSWTGSSSERYGSARSGSWAHAKLSRVCFSGLLFDRAESSQLVRKKSYLASYYFDSRISLSHLFSY